MKKKMLSFVLVMTMLCAFIPVTANAGISINIGEYVQMGTYYGEPILWRCVDIDENGPLLLADKILCIKAFDAQTSSNTATGSHSRGTESLESNYWGDSNMRSWLNSTASSGNVDWLCGNPPITEKLWEGYNTYDKEAGFLSNFTESERNAMKSVNQKSLLSYPEYENGMATTGTEQHTYNFNISEVVENYDTAYAEYVTDKMFLLDIKQINEVYNNGSILGEDYYIGEPTAQCVANSEYKNDYLAASKKWHYWLRSPDSKYSNYARCVYSSGDVNHSSADRSNLGVRPAFYLNLSSSAQSGSGAFENPYIFEAPKPTFIPIQAAAVTKSETETEWVFDVALENTYENSIVYTAVYDVNDVLLSVNSETASANSTNVKLNKVDNGAYVKIFVWTNNIQPITNVEKIEL